MKTKTWIAGLASATLLATVGFVAGGTASNADGIGIVGTPAPVGAATLTWKTTVSGKTATTTVTSSVAGSPVQTLSETGKCVLSGGSGPYLTFSATGPAPVNVGFTTNSLGVNSNKESTGLSCRQVNSPVKESLTISVGVPQTDGAGVVGVAKTAAANFDLNLSGNAVVQADLFRTGTPGAIGRVVMISGTSTYPAGLDAKAQRFDCNKDQNSGAQSRNANNCYFKVKPLTDAAGGGYLGTLANPGDALWDSITLTPLVGDFSIQGGNAWPAGSPESVGTVFSTVAFSAGQIGCYDGTTASLAFSQTSAVGDDNAVTTRLTNGSGSKCELKPYSYTDTGNTSTFRYSSVAGQSTAQFALRLPREYTAAQAAAYPPLPPVIANWEDGSADVTLRTCIPGLITGIETGGYRLPTVDYTKIEATKTPATATTPDTWSIDQSNKTAGLQYACVYAQQQEVLPDGSIIAYDYVYFHGDLKIRGGA